MPFNLEGLSLPEDFDAEVLVLVTYLMVDTMPEPLRSRVVERMAGPSLPKEPGRIVLPS